MKRITGNSFCCTWTIAGLVAALTSVVSPVLADEVPTEKQNQDGAEILDKGGVLEDKAVPMQQPGPNYPADDRKLQQDAEKAKLRAPENILRRDQDQTFTEDYDDQPGMVSWPEDYWYWPYPLSPYYY